MLNKSSMQTQKSAPTADSTVQPVPVTMQLDDTHAKATATSAASMDEKMDKMVEALQQIAGTNKAMAEKEAAAPASGVVPVMSPKSQEAKDFRSQPIGMNNPTISMQRKY